MPTILKLFLSTLLLFIVACKQQLSDSTLDVFGGRPVSAHLSGAAEVPGPGDPDGHGTALISLNPGLGM
jgi:hypothetical protein